MTRVRLSIVSGPVEAMVASAAVLHLDESAPQPLRNVLVLESLYSWHDERLRAALLACAAAVEWHEVIDVGRRGIAALGPLAEDPDSVAEVLAVRNWNGFNPQLLAMFATARKVAYGDTYGSIDNDRRPSVPQFDAAVAPIPRGTVTGALDGLDVTVIPRRTMSRVLELVRERDASLREADAELARFARGGSLMLTSCETEARRAPLRGEVAQSSMLARRAAERGRPVVVKAHPRASLGQAAAVARRLRGRGHDVRLVPSELGYYPIELFSELVCAVASVQVGHSSAGIPLAYVHGLRPRVELPLPAAATFFPHAAVESISVARYNRRALDLLARWDGDSPLPVQPLRGALEGHHAGRRPLAPRLFGWTPCDDLPPRPVALPAAELESAVRRRAARSRLPVVVTDRETASVWALPEDAGLRERFETAQAGDHGDGRERLRALLRALAPDLGGPFAVGAAVLPPTHLPRLSALRARRSGLPIVEGAVLSAEDLELELEEVAAVLDRRHERPSTRPYATFLCAPA